MTKEKIKDLVKNYSKATTEIFLKGRLTESTARPYMTARDELKSYIDELSNAYFDNVVKFNTKISEFEPLDFDEGDLEPARRLVEATEKILMELYGEDEKILFETEPKPDDPYREWFIVDLVTGKTFEYGGHTCVYENFRYYPDWGMSGSECPICGDIKFNYSDADM